jgi:hypothetical protein
MSLMSFHVTGAFLTEHYREMALEDHDSAVRGLADSLAGIQITDVYDVLAGKTRLTGDSRVGVDIEPETDTAHAQEMHEQFAGRCRLPFTELWHRPVAVIPMDYNFAHRRSFYCHHSGRIPTGEATGTWARRLVQDFIRAEGLLAPNEVTTFHGPIKDEVLQFRWWGEADPRPNDVSLIVVWEPCSAPPPWMKLSYRVRDYEAAWEDFRDNSGYYEVRRLDPVVRDPVFLAPELENAGARAREREKQEERKAQDHTKWVEREVIRIREEIQRRIGDNPDAWMTIISKKGQEFVVPKDPFYCWAMWRDKDFFPMMPKWDPISHQGVKMGDDDPYHTDWYVGAGLDPLKAYRTFGVDDEDLDDMEAAFDRAKARVIQQFSKLRPKGEFKAIPYFSQGNAKGVALRPRPGDTVPQGSIIVIPNLNTVWYPTAVNASVVLAANGGEMAHLVTELRPLGVSVFYLPDALERIPEGVMVEVHENGLVLLL